MVSLTKMERWEENWIKENETKNRLKIKRKLLLGKAVYDKGLEIKCTMSKR